MTKTLVGGFRDATSAILAAAMMSGLDGGTALDLVPTYRDAEGDARLAEAERLTTDLLGPAPERRMDLASQGSRADRPMHRSQAAPDAVRKKEAGSESLANRKRKESRRKRV